MPKHPCQRHRPGHHGDACRTAACGFCGADPIVTGTDECRACLLMVCQRCDGRSQPELGPICRPCTPPDGLRAGSDTEQQRVRLCVFDLALTCGHLATVALTGWYPVSVACCDRFGGTVLDGLYVPFSAEVDYAECLSERYENRPQGAPHAPTRVINRRSRTDAPYNGAGPNWASTGRYPRHVGAAVSLDGSVTARCWAGGRHYGVVAGRYPRWCSANVHARSA